MRVRIPSDVQCEYSTVVVRNLAKVKVVGPNPITRSIFVTKFICLRITTKVWQYMVRPTPPHNKNNTEDSSLHTVVCRGSSEHHCLNEGGYIERLDNMSVWTAEGAT